MVDLTRAANQRAGTYSHGMGQRLGIAGALLRDPRLLILDEPATGLDPAGMRDMRQLIRRLADEGITVLLSSHQLPEVQEVCDRVAIIRAGRIVYEGPLAELRGSSDRGYRLHTDDDARALELARAHPGIHELRRATARSASRPSERDAGALSVALGQAGIAIFRLAPGARDARGPLLRTHRGRRRRVRRRLRRRARRRCAAAEPSRRRRRRARGRERDGSGRSERRPPLPPAIVPERATRAAAAHG